MYKCSFKLQKMNTIAQCWDVSSARPLANSCQPGSDPPPFQDCVRVRSSWYGGSETFVQKWPFSRHNLPPNPYLTTDLPKRFGNVLERYFLSSDAVALRFPDETPLHASVVENDRICFESKHAEVRFGPNYQNETRGDLSLEYRVCAGENPKALHQFATSEGGFVARAGSLPDVRVFQHPIWSTWARFAFTFCFLF